MCVVNGSNGLYARFVLDKHHSISDMIVMCINKKGGDKRENVTRKWKFVKFSLIKFLRSYRKWYWRVFNT